MLFQVILKDCSVLKNWKTYKVDKSCSLSRLESVLMQ